MNFELELNFFCDVLKKCNIKTAFLSLDRAAEEILDPHLKSIVGFNSDLTLMQLIGRIEERTKYKFSDEFGLQYIILNIPTVNEKSVMFIGPYLSSMLTSKDILEIGERFGISPVAQKMLKEYYLAVPIIAENDRFYTLVDTFCERMWNTPSFAIVEIDSHRPLPPYAVENNPSKGESFDEITANIKRMEKRYEFENMLIRAVTLGQQHKATLLSAAFNDEMFERRVADPVRNAKNYCIIMNTLLRKAAEEGGVHPVHIDRHSSKFAMRIELMSDTRSLSALMQEMFSSYCRLVYKHTVKQYSPIVKQTILVIDSDFSAELSLAVLAKKQGISAGYLATVFKKETGRTVSEYITEKRINHATYLLTTTSLQIQTVALHCGIMDVQYFTKIFKRMKGMTPRQYREASKGISAL